MEIKIRAFNKKDKYMDYDRCNGWIISSLNYITDIWEIMLWTGILDKRGKKIYEGDIVKLQFPDYDNRLQLLDDDEDTCQVEYLMVDSIGAVEYSNSPFDVGFVVEHISGLNRWYDEMGIGFVWHELEVIGNIYESNHEIKLQ